MRPERKAAQLAAVLAGTLVIGTTAGPATAAQKHPAPVRYPAIPGLLSGVAAVSANRAWAVGDGARIAAWNGTRWQFQPAAITGPAELTAVAASSARTAWAIGEHGRTTRRRPLIVGWNGRAWKQVASPNPGGQTVLFGVAVVSARSAWAVGGDAKSYTPVILHWNGQAWKQVRLPAGGVVLTSVAAISAGNAWAVGYGYNGRSLILHWNGRAWQHVSGPRFALLESVTAVSARDAWAVGNSLANRQLILHWNGRAWQRTSVSGRGFLDGVTAVSARSAWAVGGNSLSNTPRPVILHYNGTAWQQVPVSAGRGVLAGVAATSVRDAWAVGYTTKFKTLIEHWNGTSWSIVPSPTAGADPFLTGVAARGPNDVYAVGSNLPSINGGADEGLILRWNGSAWSVDADQAGESLFGAGTVAGAGNEWAVGSGPLILSHS